MKGEPERIRTSEVKLTRAEQKSMRPQQILDAAFEEFVKNGYSAARVEDVADRVGVTKGTIYVYFQTKEDLFEQVIRHISVPFEDIIPELEALSGTASEKLVAFMTLTYNRLLGDRKTLELMRFVISEGTRFPDLIERHHTTFVAPIVTRMERILAEGVATGDFREAPAKFSEIVVAPIIASMLLRLIFGDRRAPDRQEYLDATFDLVLAGLKTPET